MLDKRCKCKLKARMLGNGCRYCQPQGYIDALYLIMDTVRGELENNDVLLSELKKDAPTEGLEGTNKAVPVSTIQHKINKIMREA
jgi:hypothetical protein